MKFSKSFVTYFFPIEPLFEEVFTRWVNHLKNDKGWGADDPLFQATLMELFDSGRFSPMGLKKVHWKTATPIRRVFRHAFEGAGCHISTRTALEIHWLASPNNNARRLKGL